MRGLGCIHDEPHVRGNATLDEVMGAASSGVHKSVFGMPATLDASALFDGRFVSQGSTNSCVGAGCGRAIQAHARRRRAGPDPAFELPSVLLGYRFALTLTGELGTDKGTTGQAYFDALNKWGFARESACPFDPARVLAGPGEEYPDELLAALDQRGVLAHRLVEIVPEARVEALKDALVSGVGVAVGMDADQSLLDWRGGVWPGMSGARLGGHMQCLWDYPQGQPRFVGSYGDGWADDGWLTTTWDVLCSEHARSIWLVTFAPQYSK